MQAFRHLYVLAAESRSIEAIDVDSRASVFVPLTVTLAPSTQVRSIDTRIVTITIPPPAQPQNLTDPLQPGCAPSIHALLQLHFPTL